MADTSLRHRAIYCGIVEEGRGGGRVTVFNGRQMGCVWFGGVLSYVVSCRVVSWTGEGGYVRTTVRWME